ncbi:MAG TPA: 30S ribosomal protein S5 [Thermoplasmata archaeon]|uniref:Small ribosomal subunit protein uS5 n=1 Tax=uncultured euryarchaeote Rifle_16ft_4_minimus_37884 TaxID=1665196 RepID=A0A0H4T615_9EURY|nr:30S ribosomal protein S5P [uncultured euryarchaeote Rifle_16ft_4_minimus_37884]
MPKRRGGKRGRRGAPRGARPERDLSEWVPKTKLGRMVMGGELTTLGDAIKTGLPIREPEIVDILLPETEDEVLDVNMVQRMTDSGRRVNFVITCIVGNKDGFAGLGRARGREVGPSIRRAIDNAKLNMIEIKRGCGSWECGCYRAHSLPFKVAGRSGSVEVVLKPAPQGVGLAVGDVAKSVLRLAGITDAWGSTRGHTKTTVNYALATFEALRNTGVMKIRGEQRERLKIKAGAEQVYVRTLAPTPEAGGAVELPEEIAVEGEDLVEGEKPADAAKEETEE